MLESLVKHTSSFILGDTSDDVNRLINAIGTSIEIFNTAVANAPFNSGVAKYHTKKGYMSARTLKMLQMLCLIRKIDTR